MSFSVAPRTIHALIGPNGAGKSTCFNAITGIYRPTSGRVRLGDAVLTDTPAHKVASLGVGRAFQNLALVASASVLDNVMLGRYSLTSGGFLSYGLRLPRTMKAERRHEERIAVLERKHAALTCTGLPGYSPTATRSASTSPGPSRWSPRCCSLTSRPLA